MFMSYIVGYFGLKQASMWSICLLYYHKCCVVYEEDGSIYYMFSHMQKKMESYGALQKNNLYVYMKSS